MMIWRKRCKSKKGVIEIKVSILTFLLMVLAPISLCFSQDVGWEDNFSREVREWYDIDDDETFNCKIIVLKDATAKVEQVGNASWGKVAKVIQDVDLDKYPIVEVKVNNVEPDSAFKIGVATLDWSKYYDIIPRQNLSGVYSGNIKKATGWSTPTEFNLIIIIEGSRKSAVFDYIKLKSSES